MNFGYVKKWKKTPLLRDQPDLPKPKRRVRAVSKKRRHEFEEYIRTREAWWLGVKGLMCPVMRRIFGKSVPVCNHPHHRFGRGRYECDTTTWLACSLEGHIWIENNKELARQHGWLAPRGEWLNKK